MSFFLHLSLLNNRAATIRCIENRLHTFRCDFRFLTFDFRFDSLPNIRILNKYQKTLITTGQMTKAFRIYHLLIKHAIPLADRVNESQSAIPFYSRLVTTGFFNMAEPELFRPPRKTSSKVWQYFGFRVKDKHEKATCKMCFTDITYPKSGATTNLINHLKRKHKLDVLDGNNNEEPAKKSSAALSPGQLRLTDLTSKLSQGTKQNITKSIAGILT